METPILNKKNYYQFFSIDFDNKTILDIGSAKGSFIKSKKFKINEIEKKAKSYTTIDLDPKTKPDIIADAHELQNYVEKNSVDIVILFNIIEHLRSPEIVLDQVYEVLKNYGSVYFTIPFLYPIHEKPNDYSRFTIYKLNLLFSNFEKVEIYHLGGYFSLVSNLIFIASKLFKNKFLKQVFKLIAFPICFIIIQADRLFETEDFPIIYYGKLTKA
jgi:SAM-dependent methyltransferase